MIECYYISGRIIFMKKVIRNMNIIAILVAFSVFFTGCGLFFNPSKYVKASFDALYKGDLEEYSKIASITTDQAQKKYDDSCAAKIDDLAKLFGFTDDSDSISIDNSVREQIKDLYKELYSKIEYTVEDNSEKIEDGYIVHVSVSPMLIFEDSMDEVNEFVSQYNADILSGKYNDTNAYSQETLNNIYQQGILTIFKKKMNDIRYGEPEEINIRVMRNNDKNSHYINADDLIKFSQLIIKYPS